MGVFTARAYIWNIKKPENKLSLDLLVDAGATYTVISSEILESLDVEPVRIVRLRLADNRFTERPLGEIGIEIEGYRASATPVVFGDKDVNLLGSVTMEQLGLAPDPVLKKLRPVEAFLMIFVS